LPIEVHVREQVREYQRKLAPEPRRALKAAILGLATERGDIRALEDDLAGFYRLRVGTGRVIFRYAEDGSIVCIFAGPRRLVYEVFSARIQEFLESPD